MLNILSQHDQIVTGSTSPLCAALAAMLHSISTTEETKAWLIDDREGTEKRIAQAAKGVINGWYHNAAGHVFDKSRGWSFNMRPLQYLSEKSFAVVMVRDPRSVVASIMEQDDKFPALDQSPDVLAKTAVSKAEQLMNDAGMIGTAILGVEDLLRRNDRSAEFVRYEDFVRWPEKVMDALMERLHLEKFDFDFENVENHSNDVDGLYLNIYTHEGTCEVTTD